MIPTRTLLTAAFALCLLALFQTAPAAPPVSPQPDDDAPRPQNPLIRGLSELLQQSEVIEDKSGLGESLIGADAILTRIKAENKRALRNVNRQLRLKGPRSPNIVLIEVAGLSPRDLGCYGRATASTPNIDALAARGVRFTDFYAGSPEPITSRLCLLTGLTAAHAGNGTARSFALQDSHFTLPEVLWKAGYSTGMVGVWGLASSPENSPLAHGNEEWFGFLDESDAANPFPPALWSNASQARISANNDGASGAYIHDVLVQQALTYLDRHAAAGPFFLHVVLPHHEPTAQLWRGTAFDTPERSEWEKARAAELARIDGGIGSLLDRLEALQIAENTIVLVTGDAPAVDASSARKQAAELRVDACPLYEGNLRIPLVVRWPGRVLEGTAVEGPCGVWDLLPTLADAVSALHRPPRLRGRTLLAALRGEPMPDPGLLYWETETDNLAQAVRLGQWKAVRKAGSNHIELYDLAADPGETTDVAEAHPEVIKKIQRPEPAARASARADRSG